MTLRETRTRLIQKELKTKDIMKQRIEIEQLLKAIGPVTATERTQR